MVDTININKIENGFVVGAAWATSKVKDVYYPDMDGVIKHLKICFGSSEKEDKK